MMAVPPANLAPPGARRSQDTMKYVSRICKMHQNACFPKTSKNMFSQCKSMPFDPRLRSPSFSCKHLPACRSVFQSLLRLKLGGQHSSGRLRMNSWRLMETLWNSYGFVLGSQTPKKKISKHLKTSKSSFISFVGWLITLVFRVAEALQFRTRKGIDLGDQLVQQLGAALIFHLQMDLGNGCDEVNWMGKFSAQSISSKRMQGKQSGWIEGRWTGLPLRI